MEKKNETLNMSLIMLGESAVGKSCILQTYIGGEFPHVHMTTIGVENAAKTVEIEDKTIMLQIWDTAGQDNFRAIGSKYYKNVDGAVLVYDITSQTTFDKIDSWVNQIDTHANKELSFILVGNKTDLEDERSVYIEEVEALAK